MAMAFRDAGDTTRRKRLGAQGPPALSAEEVVARSGLGASVVTSFLFESYLEFVAEDSVTDAASAAASFSDAMQILAQASSGPGTFGVFPGAVAGHALACSLDIHILSTLMHHISDTGKQWVDPEHLTASPADAAAGALACRGYMWANQHPAARKWQPICAPKMPQVARAAAHNRAELAERSAFGRAEMEPAVMCAVQVIPYARLMAAAIHGHPASQWLPVTWHRWWGGTAVQERGGGIEVSLSGVSCRTGDNNDIEDPIED